MRPQDRPRRRVRAIPINETERHYDLELEDVETEVTIGTIYRLQSNGKYLATASRPAPVHITAVEFRDRTDGLRFILKTTHSTL